MPDTAHQAQVSQVQTLSSRKIHIRKISGSVKWETRIEPYGLIHLTYVSVRPSQENTKKISRETQTIQAQSN